MVVLASLGSWLPFAIVAVLIILFSVAFTLRYQQKKHRDYLVTLVCSISLMIALLTASLLPTDVILVSLMKNSNGSYNDWVQNETMRDAIQQYVEVGYYVLYGLVIAMAFLVNPFLFFYYEEQAEEGLTTAKKMITAMKWTVGFLIFLLILILLGIFIPQIVKLPTNNSTSDWDEAKYLIGHFDASKLQDSITFTIFTISIIGFFLFTLFTGYGSVAFPITLFRGNQSARLQQQTIEEQLRAARSEIGVIKAKYPGRTKMPTRQKRNLEELEQKVLTLTVNEKSINVVRRSFCFKFRYIYRPMQMFFGVLLFLLALLIFISLLLSNINKCIHFTGFKQIFAQGNKTLPNPIDIILTWTGQVYPVSYIVFSLFLAYIILTSIFGLQQLGIWYFCIRMYRFSRGRTKPQALLILSSLMMFIVLAINIFIYLLIPQYSIYGGQNYASVGNDQKVTLHPCTQYIMTDQCQMTVMGRIILRFFYKVWFFGAVYFFLSWLFLIVFIVSCVIKIRRARASNIQEFSIERLLEDSNDEDNPLIQ